MSNCNAILGKTTSSIKFIQINLKHSKLASANLIVYIIENKILVALIQEPWIREGKVMGLSHRDYVVHYNYKEDERPRSCILIHKSLTAFSLSNFSDADTTVVNVEGINKFITVISAYFDRDRQIPNSKISQLLVQITAKDKLSNIIIGCDCNARNEAWVSSGNNERGCS